MNTPLGPFVRGGRLIGVIKRTKREAPPIRPQMLREIDGYAPRPATFRGRANEPVRFGTNQPDSRGDRAPEPRCPTYEPLFALFVFPALGAIGPC